MFRKILAVVIALTLSFGAFAADEIKGVFKKFEGGKLTITVDDKDKTYNVDEKATVKLKIKGEEKEIKLVDIIGKTKDGTKVTVSVEKDNVVGFKREKSK